MDGIRIHLSLQFVPANGREEKIQIKMSLMKLFVVVAVFALKWIQKNLEIFQWTNFSKMDAIHILRARLTSHLIWYANEVQNVYHPTNNYYYYYYCYHPKKNDEPFIQRSQSILNSDRNINLNLEQIRYQNKALQNCKIYIFVLKKLNLMIFYLKLRKYYFI